MTEGVASILTAPSDENPESLRASVIPVFAYCRDRDTHNKLSEALAGPLGPDSVFRIGTASKMRDALRQHRQPEIGITTVHLDLASPLCFCSEALQANPNQQTDCRNKADLHVC